MTVKIAYKAVLVPALAIIVAFGLFAVPSALASPGGGDTTTVNNNNSAEVANYGIAVANTGLNQANGDSGGDGGDGGRGGRNAGDGGDGGDVDGGDGCEWECDGFDVGSQTTGDGGDGGDTGDGGEGGEGGEGGDGGDIDTGDALATVLIGNDVNSNDTTIDNCGCDDDNEWRPRRRKGSDVEVNNNNQAVLLNFGLAVANTGLNRADGDSGGSGGDGGNGGNNAGDAGDGGDINGDGYVEGDQTTGEGGDGGETGDGGDGADGGDGGDGGDITTGDADSLVGIVNIINRNMTRIRR